MSFNINWYHFFQTVRLKTGCIAIDEILGGGLLCPGVTEVAGESSSGKTQFCIQTSIFTSMLNPGHSMTSNNSFPTIFTKHLKW